VRRSLFQTMFALVATSVLFAACAADGPQERGTAVVITTTTQNAAPDVTNVPATGLATSPVDRPATTDATPTPASTTPAASGPPVTEPRVGNPQVTSVEVGRFDQPVDLKVRPDDPALYIVEQPGRVVRYLDDRAVTVADVTDRTSAGSERGLLGLAFSPDGRRAYLDYTSSSGDTVVAEYPVLDDGEFEVDDERVVLTVDQPFGNHNGGDLQFGADGMLYIALGDGGSSGDPRRNASDPSTLLGSILRIDPSPTGEAAYSIPPDNPFANGTFNGVQGAPEVWSYGLRNPWRIAFDPLNGDLWIADVGQNAVEEVDVVSPTDGERAGRGANFGWSAWEGTQRYNEDVDAADAVPPVLTYLHGDDGCSVSGGALYRGSAIPDLEPAYVYSDYCSGIVWALDLAGGRNLTLLDGFERVSGIRVGPDGELYVLELGGRLSRLIAG
jgi:glucose/arabinose dehydrogenase